MLKDCEIIENTVLKNDYMRIRFSAPEICAAAKPGQFVHIRVPMLGEHILRRPFSICSFRDGVLTVVYKIVGAGTARLAEVPAGTKCSIMGPLGTPFPELKEDQTALLICGGYGAAATLPVADIMEKKSILLLGARSEKDVLLTDEYKACGTDVRVATQDGSCGEKGLVTDLLASALEKAVNPVIFACGPNGMLMAVGKLAMQQNIPAYLSMDHRMCCGIGACFACVVKVRDSGSPDGWRYSRSCMEGPVYNAEEVWYE